MRTYSYKHLEEAVDMYMRGVLLKNVTDAYLVISRRNIVDI